MRSLLAILMLLFTLKPAAAAVTVSLYAANSNRTTEPSRLRDIASVTGNDRFLVAAISNMQLPATGQAVLDAEFIRAAIKKEGLDASEITVTTSRRRRTTYFPTYGSRTTRSAYTRTGITGAGVADMSGTSVDRQAAPFMAKTMDAAVRGYIARRYGHSAKRIGWRLVYKSLSPRVADTRGAEYIVSDIQTGKGRNAYNVSVELLREGKTISKGSLDIQAWANIDWLVFKHPMKAGDVVSAKDVELRPVMVADFTVKPEVRLNRVVGARLLRSFASGTRISTDFLGGILAVKKDDKIQIRVRTASFNVNMMAVAMEDGSEGSVVKAELQSTGKLVFIRITGSGSGHLVDDQFGNDGE